MRDAYTGNAFSRFQDHPGGAGSQNDYDKGSQPLLGIAAVCMVVLVFWGTVLWYFGFFGYVGRVLSAANEYLKQPMQQGDYLLYMVILMGLIMIVDRVIPSQKTSW